MAYPFFAEEEIVLKAPRINFYTDDGVAPGQTNVFANGLALINANIPAGVQGAEGVDGDIGTGGSGVALFGWGYWDNTTKISSMTVNGNAVLTPFSVPEVGFVTQEVPNVSGFESIMVILPDIRFNTIGTISDGFTLRLSQKFDYYVANYGTVSFTHQDILVNGVATGTNFQIGSSGGRAYIKITPDVPVNGLIEVLSGTSVGAIVTYI